MPRPDTRTASSGRHPEGVGYDRAIGSKRKPGDSRLQRDMYAVVEAALVNNDLPEGNERMWLTPEEAAAVLGLEPEKTRKAAHLISQVAKDARDLMGISKAAREAGIPNDRIQLLIRSGVLLGHRQRMGLNKAEAAVGEVRDRKGGKFKKVAKKKWDKVSDGGGKKGEAPEKNKRTMTHDDPDIRARHGALDERAKAVGINLGKLHPKHSHNHLDRAEAVIKQHEDGKAKHDPKAPGPETGAEGADGNTAGIKRDESGRPTGHDAPPPSAVHETHRLAQLVHDVQDRLKAIEDRLEGAHQKGMFGELQDEGQTIAKKPSPQSVQWHTDRVTSFLKLITGAAIGVATGSDPTGAALAGAAEGKSSTLHVQAGEAGEKAAKDARSAATGEGEEDKKPAAPPEDKEPQKEDAKKSVLLDPRTGRLLFKATKPTPEIMAEPVGESDEDEEEADHDDKVDQDGDGKPDAPPVKKAIPPPPPAPRVGVIRKARSTKPKNDNGHRDGLVPGMRLQLRKRHQGKGDVTVCEGGKFKLGDEEYRNGTDLLHAIHDGQNPNTTIRRYFRLGGENKVRKADMLHPLRRILKADQVLVQRVGDGYALTGDLNKAGVPAYLLPDPDAHYTKIDRNAAAELHKHLENR